MAKVIETCSICRATIEEKANTYMTTEGPFLDCEDFFLTLFEEGWTVDEKDQVFCHKKSCKKLAYRS